MIQVQTRNPKFVCVSSQVVNNTPSIHTEKKYSMGDFFNTHSKNIFKNPNKRWKGDFVLQTFRSINLMEKKSHKYTQSLYTSDERHIRTILSVHRKHLQRKPLHLEAHNIQEINTDYYVKTCYTESYYCRYNWLGKETVEFEGRKK